MCGISAIFSKKPILEMDKIVYEMAIKQKHRGPEHIGVYANEDKTIGLSHARLSIIDISSAGNQPLFNESGSICVVCNGEIFNYAELKQNLLMKGHEFRSSSDSEVLLHLYEEYKYDFLEKLRGMYAFVLYDQNDQSFFCVRDRLGEKPLIYAQNESGISIASEIPAVRCYGNHNLDINPLAVSLYLTRGFRHIPEPWTIFEGIKKLPAGHAMVVKQGEVKRLWKYWNPSFKKRNVSVEEVREAFDEAVRIRSISDVEIGAMLSGGVDSSGIVYSLTQNSTAPIRTYALGRDQYDDELPRARLAANLYHTKHKEFYFDSEGMLQNFERLIEINGEPIMLLPLLSSFEICKHIWEDGLKVVMTGNGADEIFYGYDGNGRMALLSLMLKFIPDGLRPQLRKVAERMQGNSIWKQALLVASQQTGDRRATLFSNEAEWIKKEIFEKDFLADRLEEQIKAWVHVWIDNAENMPYIDETNFIGLMAESTHSVIIPGDLAAMAASVEARAPFLDHKLVELALQIPYSQKVKSIKDATKNKWILKKAFEGRVPNELLYAPKRGFGFNISERDLLLSLWNDRYKESFEAFNEYGDLFNIKNIAEHRERFETMGTDQYALIPKMFALGYFLKNFK